MIFYTALVAFVWLTIKHSFRTAFSLAVLPYVLFILYRFSQYRRHVKLLSPLPTYGPFLITPFSNLWSVILPHLEPLCFEQNPSDNELLYGRRAAVYDAGKSTNMVVGSILPPAAALHTADEVTIAHIYSDRFTFQKPLFLYERFKLYGPSILCTELDQWKKHKRVVIPAFGEGTHELAWQESTRVVRAWMVSLEEIASKSENGIARVNDVRSVTLHMALAILATVAFGTRIACPGEPDDRVPANHPYSLRNTLEGSLHYLFITLAAPGWLRALPIGILKKAKLFKDEQTQYMREIIDERRKAMLLGEDKKDVLTQLIKAEKSFNNGSKESTGLKVEPLTQDELLGNVFTILVAGHETSAHTLTFALGRLALNPQVQDWLFEQVEDVLPDPAVDLPYKDYFLFDRALAIVNETLRLHSIITEIPKLSKEDAVVPCSERSAGGQKQFFIPKNTYIALDVQRLHRDPHHWPDPMTFKPQRFIDTDTYKWPRSAFAPFSAGSRACIGEKMAKVELVCILAHLCRQYKIRLTPETEAIKDPAERARTLVAATTVLTLTPKNVSVCFERRKGV